MIYGLIGRKLGHSFSVPIHEYMGNKDYRLYPLEPEELEGFLRRDDLGGVNVTIPYKRDVIPFCDELDERARAIGAVNTVVRRGGRLIGFNTDITGFEMAVRRAGLDFSGRKVVILGSGGTSRTAREAARELGAGEIAVISRSGEDNYENLWKHQDAGIVVNTTPVGMSPDCPAAPLSLDAFPECEGVMDVIYNPLRTALVMEAEERGIPACGGLVMLVAQAKAAEELFFSSAIPDSKVEKYCEILSRRATDLVIIGMPGSGKTTLGRLLSGLSGRELVDVDAEIAVREGRTPEEIITQDGETAFRDIEHRVLEDVMRTGGRIVATGGGAVTRPDNYPLLHQNGRIYCITREAEYLATAGRPLSGDLDALREMEERRRGMYRRFMDVEIENTGRPDETAKRIWRDFCENTCY